MRNGKKICLFSVIAVLFLMSIVVFIKKDSLFSGNEAYQKNDSTTEQELESQDGVQKDEQDANSKTDAVYVSILGDSLSTYEGFSNSGWPNTTTAGYNAYYNGDRARILNAWTETYWGQVISKYGMELLVNNSCGGNRLTESGGTRVTAAAGYIRAQQLAANTGDLNGITPDIVFLHMGTNDYIGNVSVDIFKTAYIRTLDTMLNLYPDVEIYCFTLTPSNFNKNWDTLYAYNTVIRDVVAEYSDNNVILVDVASGSEITTENYPDYTFDGTHYNNLGIAEVVKELEKALSTKYSD